MTNTRLTRKWTKTTISSSNLLRVINSNSVTSVISGWRNLKVATTCPADVVHNSVIHVVQFMESVIAINRSSDFTDLDQ